MCYKKALCAFLGPRKIRPGSLPREGFKSVSVKRTEPSRPQRASLLPSGVHERARTVYVDGKQALPL